MEVFGEQGECGMGVQDAVGCETVAEEVLQRDVDEVLNGFLGNSLKEQADGMRCQVKITTRHSLQLRMANYTARDVYVRLLGHGERITGTGMEATQI